MLSAYLIKKYGIQSNKRLLTGIDQFKIYRDFDAYQADLKTFDEQNSALLNDIEKHIINLELNPVRKIMYLLSQTHMGNYFGDIAFILQNRKMLDAHDIIYNDAHLLRDIAKETINIFDTISKKYVYVDNGRKKDLMLFDFYNWPMFEKLISCYSFKKTDFGNNVKMHNYWNIYFVPAANLVKKHLLKIQNKMKFELSCNIGGLSTFPKKIYEYYATYLVGLDLDIASLTDYKKLAIAELQTEKDRVCEIGSLLFKTKCTYKEYLELFLSDTSQNFNSETEVVDMYKKEIEKQRCIFINELGFAEYNKPDLHVFANENLAGGYYWDSYMFLNVHDFNSMKKYDVRSLVSHEVIPGHHLQFDSSYHYSQITNDILSTIYPVSTGFIEGWGLYSESLCGEKRETKQELFNEFGKIQMNILRICRLLADIELHTTDLVNFDDIILILEENLAHSQSAIISEILRYVAMPAQAIAYKIGEITLSEYFNNTKNSDLLDSVHVENYKKLIIDGEKPLKFVG
jgi:hypothetical protein